MKIYIQYMADDLIEDVRLGFSDDQTVTGWAPSPVGDGILVGVEYTNGEVAEHFFFNAVYMKVIHEKPSELILPEQGLTVVK